MKALENIMVLVISLFLWSTAFGQIPSDREIFNRYCKKGEGKYIYRIVPLKNEANEKQIGPDGEELTYQRPRIECQYGPTPRYVFETKNGVFIKVDNNSLILKEDPDSKEKKIRIIDRQGVESDYFSSPKWLAFIQNEFIKNNKKAIEDSRCPVKTAKTEFIGGKYLFTCGNFKLEIDDPKKVKEEYILGLEDYLQDKISIKDILEAKSIFPKAEEQAKNDKIASPTVEHNTSATVGDNTIIRLDKVIDQPDQKNTINYKFHAKEIKPYEIKAPKFSYAEFVKSQRKSLLPDRAMKFKASIPQLSYLDFGADEADVFSKYGETKSVLNRTPRLDLNKGHIEVRTNYGSDPSLNNRPLIGPSYSNKYELQSYDGISNSKTVEDQVTEDSNCEEELNKALAALLEKDDKNIIGLQYELTVLKVASAVVGTKNTTLEGMIRQQSKSIAEADKTKILEQMEALYKKHGLPEDQEKIYEHLKTKSASANYYAGDKRFFNQESSAFMIAYKHLNPESGIKETDISVLWYMDKVSEKAKGQWSNFSAGHNLTNLSTRVAHYTGGINPDGALGKEKLEEMVERQKSKINKELLALIEDFKNNNQSCFNKLFAEGGNHCNLGVVEESLSKLLAISAKIASTDQISLDNYLKGGLDKSRFKLSRYVDQKIELAK